MRGERGFREDADEALLAAEDLVKATGARIYLPFLREERAALEAAVGDAAARGPFSTVRGPRL